MTDDPPPKRRQRSKLPVKGGRTEVVEWMRTELEAIEADAAARIELARQGHDHPTPVYQRMVKHFSGMGLSVGDISKLTLIEPAMINAYYSEEIESGKAEIKLRLGQNLMRGALDPSNPKSPEMALRVLERWSENFKPPAQQIQHTKPKDTENVIDSSKLTSEEREQLRAMILRQQGGETEPETGVGVAALEQDGESEAG